ncbi:MAG: DUF3565 domain-containing protein [Planctomycetota bacterium]
MPSSSNPTDALPQAMVGFHQDEEDHWVAELECGHNQHVRHLPPLIERDWVQTSQGRAGRLGMTLPCKKCVSGDPPDRP